MARRVVIVGAGPAGLAAAYRLQGHDDLQVTLIEKEAEAGGRNRSLELAPGFFADNSAQFFAGNYSQSFGLMKKLGIFRKLEEMDVRSFSGIYRDGRILDLPAGLLGLARCGTLSWRERAALLRLGVDIGLRYRPGALHRPGRLEREDAIQLSEYVRRKYGEGLLENIVEPIAAMTMGKAEQLSLVPIISMSGIVAARHYTLPTGNGEFTRSLASACGGARLGTKVRRIVVDQGTVRGVEVEPDGGFLPADTVLCCLPAPDAAPLLADLGVEPQRFLASVPYSTCIQVLFGTPRPQLGHYAVFISPSSGSLIDSVTEETFKSRRRAPTGSGLTQAFVTGENARKLLELDDPEIAERVYQELRILLPDFPTPACSRVIRRRRAMVLSEPGFQRRLARFNAQMGAVEGLHMMSDYQSNPLIEASVRLGEEAARRILMDRTLK